MTKTSYKKIISTYYAVLALFLLIQTVSTVIKLSQTIAYQHRISALQTQKKELIQQTEQIEIELGSINSLAALQAVVQEEYQPINTLVVLQADQALALQL